MRQDKRLSGHLCEFASLRRILGFLPAGNPSLVCFLPKEAAMPTTKVKEFLNAHGVAHAIIPHPLAFTAL